MPLMHRMAETMAWWARRVLLGNPDARPSGQNRLFMTHSERVLRGQAVQTVNETVGVSLMSAEGASSERRLIFALSSSPGHYGSLRLCFVIL